MTTATNTPCHPIIAGETTHTSTARDIPDRHTGQTLATLHLAAPTDIERAIAAAHDAARQTADLTPDTRAGVLRHLASRVTERRDHFARTIALEAGKTLADAQTETDRCITTLTLSAEAAEQFPQSRRRQIHPDTDDLTIEATRIPVGPCTLITPFNFPLNLAAHKLGPAIAAGNPFILKPADKAPLSATMLAEILLETEYPPAAVNCLVAEPRNLAPLTEDPRIRFLSFTGSVEVGWKLRTSARGKRVALELGGDAACIIDEHLTPDQIEHAAKRLTRGAFGYAGQSCISTQRVILHRAIAENTLERFIEHTKQLKNKPWDDPDSFIGPMIDTDAADRIEHWIQQAIDAGATLHTGGKRTGNTITPAILSDVPKSTPLGREEAFGPVAVVSTADSFQDAIDAANDSPFGIHAGVFTNNTEHARHAAERLDVAGVVVNDVPTLRHDAEPYGGIKLSGIGREGPEFALLEMTELRSITTKTLP